MSAYNDDYMIVDARGRYVLTETGLESEGIFLRARLSRSPSVDPTAVINALCRTVTTHIYNYIHSFSANNPYQDRLICTVPSLRAVMFDALIEQIKFVILNGDWSVSPEKEKRENAVSLEVKDILSTTVPELGCSILYAGG